MIISGRLASSPIHVEENKALAAFAPFDLGFLNGAGSGIRGQEHAVKLPP
jgi:hypothetical protein